MSGLVDTHCHLDFKSFDEDRPEILARAWRDGLERILVPGINIASSQVALRIAESHDQIFAAVGVHPNEALSWREDTLNQLRHLAEHPKVVAIGEIGLDYYRDRAPQDMQANIFKAQLSLASELNLPVVIHNREATEDVLRIIAEWQDVLAASGSPLADHPGVLHSFSGHPKVAKKGINHNFYLGITGPVTFKNADDLREAVSNIPIERLLIETDAPFLTPHPYRGKRNEPAFVRFVAEKIAEIKEEPREVVAIKTTSNAKNLFNW